MGRRYDAEMRNASAELRAAGIPIRKRKLTPPNEEFIPMTKRKTILAEVKAPVKQKRKPKTLDKVWPQPAPKRGAFAFPDHPIYPPGVERAGNGPHPDAVDLYDDVASQSLTDKPPGNPFKGARITPFGAFLFGIVVGMAIYWVTGLL